MENFKITLFTPGPDSFDHIDDWQDGDFKDDDNDFEDNDENSEERGGCMPDPEDFDD